MAFLRAGGGLGRLSDGVYAGKSFLGGGCMVAADGRILWQYSVCSALLWQARERFMARLGVYMMRVLHSGIKISLKNESW